jgi:peptidoglycan/xylan/chitin deacetylase (PgdA/CDA1 family)
MRNDSSLLPADMRRNLKLGTLGLMKKAGVFERIANSGWRRERLLILCYHGIALEDEQRWRPALYMQASQFAQRLETLKDMRCSVLPLGEALNRLRSGDLPPRAVAITFDDGTFDFYKNAYPLLRQHGFPVTVYQTTYYTDHELPVFNLICSYMLWQKRGQNVLDAKQLGLSDSIDLRTEASRQRGVRDLIDHSERQDLNGEQKNELAAQLAELLGVDYALLTSKRLLQLMNAKELAEVTAAGVDIQLHTHRHRTPNDEPLFRKEIRENRDRVRALTGKEPTHFCYPGGIYEKEFPGWLQKENVLSATTCDVSLVHRKENLYLLPRLVDTSGKTTLEFESWVCGLGPLLTLRRAAKQQFVLPKDDRD